MHNRQSLNKQKLTYQQLLPLQLVTAVIILDEKQRIQYANPSAEALFGRSFSRLYEQNFSDAFVYTTLSSGRLAQVLTTGQEFTDSEVIFEFLEQNHITVELTASSVDFNNSPHILIEVRRVDSQKQISLEAFQQQQWEAARDLIRGLAHEIKNPLGGLRGAAQLLNRELTEHQQEYTKLIIEQSDRLTHLVDNLLGPNQLPQYETGNIHKVIETVHQLVSLDNPKNIKFSRDYDPSIPDSQFDNNKLQQAILNIVNNAIQVLNDNGTITFKTRIASNQTINSKRVRLSIQISIIDNGPGIPATIQDTLFYPMVSARENGTGMGLSISQTLINQHQGKLSCQSYPGRTEFIILLPFPDEND